MSKLALRSLVLFALCSCGNPDVDPAELETDSAALAIDPDLEAEDDLAPPVTQAAPASADDRCTMTGARAEPLEVFVNPQGVEAPVLAAIAHAEQSLRVMVYQLTAYSIRHALANAAKAGLDVRVILDRTQTGVNQAAYNELIAAGAQVQWSTSAFTYTHAKFLVADGAVAVISTGNYDTYMKSGRNFGATDRDPDDVQTLTTIFDGDWQHTTTTLPCTRLVVSPNNARARHLQLINSATTSLTFEEMQLSDWPVRNAILARKKAGVDVRVILAAPSWVSANQAAGAWLKANGIAARWRKSPAIHAKAFVIDGKTAFFGSENLSKTSLTYNREIGLVTTTAADVAIVADTFANDWATATPF